MNRAAGIALISVLLIMLSIMLVGLGTLMLTNSSLMISQNLIGHSIARTNADAGIDATVTALRVQVQETGRRPATVVAPPVRLSGATVDYRLDNSPQWIDDVTVIRVKGSGPRGATHVAEAVVEYSEAAGGRGVAPYSGMILACEAITVSGGGRIDSFDSRSGPYRSGSANRNAHVRTLGPGGSVTITGYAPIWGDVHSTGSVTARGSSGILGNIHASGNINIHASTTYDGNMTAVGGILFDNTATVTGSVSAGSGITFANGARVRGNASSGGDIIFGNTGARIDGNALAAGSITRQHNNSSVRHVGGVSQENGSPAPDQPVAIRSCDPLNIDSMAAGFQSAPEGRQPVTADANREVRLTPTEALTRTGSWVNDWSALDGVAPVEGGFYRLPQLDMTSNSQLHIAGGDVVLFVDGDFTFSGNSKMRIEPGSTLTVYVSGRTSLGNSFDMDGIAPVNDAGQPVFSLYSLNRSAAMPGVSISGNAKVSGTVYAPHTAVRLDGSGELFGSVLGRRVEVPGGTGLHYDEALAEVEVGGGSGSDGTPASIRVLSRR